MCTESQPVYCSNEQVSPVSDYYDSFYLTDCPFELVSGLNLCFCRSSVDGTGSTTCTRVKFIRHILQSTQTPEDKRLLCEITLLHLRPFLEQMLSNQLGEKCVRLMIRNCSQDVLEQHVISNMPFLELMTDTNGSFFVEFLCKNFKQFCPHIMLSVSDPVDFTNMCFHSKGNFPMKALIQNVGTEDIQMMMYFVKERAREFAIHEYGSRCIQELFVRVYHFHSTYFEGLGEILTSLVDMGTELIAHPHGNYAAQAMIPLLPRPLGHRFIDVLSLNFVQLSQHRFSSAVIERALKNADEFLQRELIDAIVGLDQKGVRIFLSTNNAGFILTKALENKSKYHRKRLESLQRRL